MEFDWWNTIQKREKLPNVHVVQWWRMFWLDFGRCFHDTWWTVSCLACALLVKERKKHVLTKKFELYLSFPINLDLNRWGTPRPQTITFIQWAQNFWLMSFFVHSSVIQTSFIRKQYPNAVISAWYSNAMIWLVRDTYPNAAIWLVRATCHSIR